MSALGSGEGQFLSPMAAAQVDERLPRATWALYLIAAAVVAFVAWASLTRVDEVARADGRLVPDGPTQVIASLESGLLGELLVKEGDLVVKGQDLVRLDPTRVEAAQNEGQVRLLALKALVARLRAEAHGKELRFPPELAEAKAQIESERESYTSRRRLLEESLAGMSSSLSLVQKELTMARQMAAQGLMSNVEVMRLTRQVSDLQQARQERLNRFRQDASGELVRAQNDLAALEEQLVVRSDQLKRTVLTSPVAGVVKAIKNNTVGGVVTSGSPILEIAPMGGRTLIEARVRPRDIGFVAVGQKAEIKLAGYDVNVYGDLLGRVDYIGPDAMGEPDRGPDATYYRVLVVGEENRLKQVNGKNLPLIPGMGATVDIRTGERSVLSYLVRPMLKSQEALRER
ncbi:HlyD family type I secretion periplasmic adaptor subunit [Inhella gelatinilytica]|uniref:Membrane fusion protein (MFP) family protein n=1 Tax=Inhella gelatinilytica TaxID=2795030 RepID=A0A931IZY5_9BURK|nr:HlyD family type I secretion periplasmic adaptor subunit [Inhella gelatinilytica]MBH9552886.1 HlyD family type I secretion periplasmic adaptor subunit [Inhella gelatinilytica]